MYNMLMVFHRRFLSGNLSTTIIISGVLLMIGTTFLLFIMPNLITRPTDLWLGQEVFKARLALTDETRSKGLSGTKEMNPDEALLMVFPKDGLWGIWMKNMNFPIDAVWLDKDKKVTTIVKNIPFDESTTAKHQPKTPARYIIELPAGTVDDAAISVGDVAVFQFDEGGVR
jgi:uncharacterized protein